VNAPASCTDIVLMLIDGKFYAWEVINSFLKKRRQRQRKKRLKKILVVGSC